jgi:hypothetical protein
MRFPFYRVPDVHIVSAAQNLIGRPDLTSHISPQNAQERKTLIATPHRHCPAWPGT